MKIGFIYRYFTTTGGVERTLIDKANYLVQQGHSVTIVTFEQGKHPFAYKIDDRIEHIELDCRRFTLYHYPKYKRVFKLWQMNRRFVQRWNAFVKEAKPDIVITTTNSGDFLREILTARDKTNIIVESHTAFIYDMGSDSLIRKLWLKRYMRIVKQGKMIISLTQGDAQFWKEHGAKRVIVLPNPLTMYPETINDVEKDPYRIIFVGRFDKVKRIDLLVSAFALIAEKYPLWHIDVYGGGETDDFEQLIIDNHLVDRIKIHQPTPDIFTEYKKSQMLVLCSSYEGFGLVLIEAMSCGTPCVSFDCPYGPPEIIKDHYNGLLAKNGDIKDLADKMEWLITHPEERYTMGINAHQYAAQFKKDVVMKDWENAYNALIDDNMA